MGSLANDIVRLDVAARLAEHLGEEDLTMRELEVLERIRDGYRNKEIADKLSISENTVNFHSRNLVGKLGLTIERMQSQLPFVVVYFKSDL